MVEFCIYMNTLVIAHADCTCALPLVDEDIMHLFMYLTFEDQDSLSTIKSNVSDVDMRVKTVARIMNTKTVGKMGKINMDGTCIFVADLFAWVYYLTSYMSRRPVVVSIKCTACRTAQHSTAWHDI